MINSKTFTTAETILNAKSVKQWLIEEYTKLGHKFESADDVNKVCNAHLSAVSTNIQATT